MSNARFVYMLGRDGIDRGIGLLYVIDTHESPVY